jgi:arginyl-tRNA synthetase
LGLEPAERELIKKLLAFPPVVAEAAARRAPHLVAAYALETAQVFTAFYRDCPVLKCEDEALKSFRLATCVASRRVIARALDLLGVAAPATM